MAPVIDELKARSQIGIESIVISTGQHQELMHPILDFFRISPDMQFELMKRCRSPNALFAAAVAAIDRACCDLQPDVVLVHGDTTTAAAAAIAAFHNRVKVGHVEAGLRTGNLGQPWPEELNRRLITPCTSFHFAPTRSARLRLLGEGVAPDRIIVTGNTVIDALLSVASRLEQDRSARAALDARFGFLDAGREVLLVTSHRRESFGDGIRGICSALLQLSERERLEIVFPVHPNPNVREPVHSLIGGRPNIHLIPPADYVAFVYLMMRSSVILTDSGGVQEEAPSLGKPVLVMRSVTERPEAIATGVAKLVGTDPAVIVPSVLASLDEVRDAKPAMRGGNPYGDGRAAQRIVEHLIAVRAVVLAGNARHGRIGSQADRMAGISIASPPPTHDRLPGEERLEVGA